MPLLSGVFNPCPRCFCKQVGGICQNYGCESVRGEPYMKNPLEYSLLEVEAFFRDDATADVQRAFALLLRYVYERQKYLTEYRAQKTQELIARARKALPERQPSAASLRQIDNDLLDTAEIVLVDSPTAEAVDNV